ncbi:ferritin Dps family protein [Actinobaculum suis]|uniref:Ferritin Dps family protein n=1 Tax=Actinobaculum suis TaxID=1657 RepID=A0A0K9ESI2_9ACTO|nr:DNA starvation/stationary phase protection protein [Actinobaculum suis]KMY22845.1 ferritin [Actinobaculum suis]OCA94263.1 DNA starvation/stationary phase protection protein [Actinobaculum suis]OCA94518.1 DNA starvation/stationary phase protection protein [Actinobaculum suis]VDG76603.1 ferritin Dps family protein [Actinobaculum suis]
MAEKIVVDALQRALVDLTDLTLQAKQYHWNIQGTRFRALHLALDEVVDVTREDSDEVAERIAQIGGYPDARAATVAKDSGLADPGVGPFDVAEAYATMAEKLQQASDRILTDLDKVDEADPYSGDILVGVGKNLEKQAWFFRAAK